MWWTYVLVGIVMLYQIDAQVTQLEYSTNNIH